MAPPAFGGSVATIGCMHSRIRAWPSCGTIGCGGIGPGQPIGLAVIGFAVIGGHRFGATDGGTSGCCWVGEAPGCRGMGDAGPGPAVLAAADPLVLEVAGEPRVAWGDDVQAAVNSAASTIALSVARLVMVIGL